MSKTYCTIPVFELDNVNFSATLITSANTTPRNVAGDTALVKWSGDMPSSIAGITSKGSILDHAGALELLATDAWTDSEEL